ncbi:MAG: hypothetical protein P8Z80_11455 [Pseudolabrys sp.]
MREFLTTMQQKYPALRVRDYEVYFNPDNGRLFERMARAYRFEIQGVPTAFRQCLAQGCPSPSTPSTRAPSRC